MIRVKPDSSRPGRTTGKVMYATEEEAMAAGRKFQQRHYVCSQCFQYHLTHQTDGHGIGR